MFLFNINVFGLEKNKVEKHQFLVKRGVATKRFFNEPVFCKMWKTFGPFFWHILVLFKKHFRIGISAHFWKQKNKTWPFFKAINWAKSRLLIGPSWGSKRGQLGPVNNVENLRNVLFYFKMCWNPFLIVLCDKHCLFKTNLAQLITLKMAKLGPVNNSTAILYIYIYLFIHIDI